MPRHIAGSSIAVSFSTRGVLMPAWMVQHVASVANVDGVDVDAMTPLCIWLASRGGTHDRPLVPIRSIWAPLEGIHSSRVRRLIEATLEQQPVASPLIVLTSSGSHGVRELTRSFQTFSTLAQSSRVAIGLTAHSLRGGRPHLVQMAGIRRFAEEWDLTVAIDLSGRFDPTWEAEAAISRLGSRLKLLRVPSGSPSRSAVGRDRVACRALHAAIDRVERLDVAISPRGSWAIPVTPRAAARSAERAAEYVEQRAAHHLEALRQNIGRYEDSPSARGG